MHRFLRRIHGDMYKLKRRKMVPICMIATLLLTACIIWLINRNGYSEFMRRRVILEVWTLGITCMIGLLSIVVMGSEDRSRYKGMLTGDTGGVVALASKLVLINMFVIMSIFISLMLFNISEKVMYGAWVSPIFLMGTVLEFSAVSWVISAWAAWVLMKWGQVGVMIYSVTGILSSGIMMTYLGERTWMYCPFVWSGRIGERFMLGEKLATHEVLIMGTIWIVSLGALAFWIRRWEGGRSAS